jgi:TolB-like protein/tetratricopeptide (TPR) repeat protein
MGGFWSELKRRSVVKVGIAYCAVGWVVVQVAALLFPMFGAPAWIPKVVTTLVFLGLPLALIFAWAFELTPQGIKRTEETPREDTTPRRGRRKLDYLIAGVLAAAVVLFALDRFVWKTDASDPATRVADEPASAPPHLAASTHGSIAVLPFVNMSNDPDQEYFSDGIAEDLMSALARFRTLKVAARTSAFSFKGKQVDLQDVGRSLNVATVLEGSVRRVGDRLRITAQLNDVASGYQLWSETYDRELTDIFAIQDDITSRIVSALQVHLDEEPARAVSAPVDPDVYQRVLRGRFHWNQRTPEGLAKAAELLQEATRLAPDYAAAYSALADVYLSQYDYGLLSWEESTVKARAAATKGLELDETSAAAQTSLAHILLHEWQWQAAEQHFLRALELDPNYTLALHWYALCLTALGRTDEAVEVMRRARQLDPLSVRINADLGMALLAAGKYHEAVEQEGRALELSAKAAGPLWIRGMALEQLKRYEAAEQDLKAALEATSGYEAVKGSLGHLYAISGRRGEARALLDELAGQAGATDVTFFAALICAGLDDKNAALTWLERAVEKRSGSVRYLKIDPRLAGLRNEPRYERLMERVGLPR